MQYEIFVIIALPLALAHILTHVIKRIALASIGDYLVSGRKFGVISGALVLTFASCSGWYGLGSPAIMYTYGYIEVILFTLWAVGGVLMWYFLGYWMRDSSRELGTYTVPETIARMHGANVYAHLSLAVLTALGIVAFAVGQLIAIARVISTFSGVDFTTAAIIGAIIIGSYTPFSGLWGIYATTLAAASLMYPVILFEFVFAVNKFGGILGLDERIISVSPQHAVITGEPYGVGWFAIISVGIAYGLWNLLPQNTMNILALDKRTDVRKFALVFGLLSLILILHFWFGLAARLVVPPGVMNPENAVLEAYKILLPTWASIVAVSGIFYMAVTTLDNLVLAGGGALLRDIVLPIARHLGKEINDKTQLRLARLFTLVILLLVLYWTVTRPPPFIAFIGATGSAALVGAYMPWIIYKFYRGSSWGIIGSCIAGIIGVLLIWYGILGWSDGIVAAAALSTALYLLISVIVKKVNQNKINWFRRV